MVADRDQRGGVEVLPRAARAVPERETSVRQLIGRVVDTIAGWGESRATSPTPTGATPSRAELTASAGDARSASFNSPVYFNVGIEPKPQCSACFILKVDDNMESILDWYRNEGIIFKGGSGLGRQSVGRALVPREALGRRHRLGTALAS